jgi:hypothetical protein
MLQTWHEREGCAAIGICAVLLAILRVGGALSYGGTGSWHLALLTDTSLFPSVIYTNITRKITSTNVDGPNGFSGSKAISAQVARVIEDVQIVFGKSSAGDARDCQGY